MLVSLIDMHSAFDNFSINDRCQIVYVTVWGIIRRMPRVSVISDLATEHLVGNINSQLDSIVNVVYMPVPQIYTI